MQLHISPLSRKRPETEKNIENQPVKRFYAITNV